MKSTTVATTVRMEELVYHQLWGDPPAVVPWGSLDQTVARQSVRTFVRMEGRAVLLQGTSLTVTASLSTLETDVSTMCVITTV